MEIINFSNDESTRYTHDQWVKRNGGAGFKIVDAAKNDTLAQWFYEVMRQAPYITPEDPRLAIAYGYFVGAEIVSQEEANLICGFEVESLTRVQTLALIGV